MNNINHHWISDQQAQAAFANDHRQAQRYANLYHYCLGAIIFVLFLTKTCIIAEMVWWHQKNNKARQINMGYDMSAAEGDQHVQRATIPIWRRILRAWMAFVHKYFAEVRVPVINLSLAELGIILDYVSFLGWCLLHDAPDIPPSRVAPFTIRGFSNRAGLLTFASLPFNVLLSSKMNLISYLTGVNHDRIQYLHRWVGRSTLALAVIHASTKLTESDHFAKTTFRNYGLGAFCVACVMLIINNRWFMRYFYETFVALHKVMVIALIVLAWKHQPGHKHYLIVSICLWVVDHTLRYIRIFYYNGLWRFNKNGNKSIAALRLLSHDTTRLEIFKPDFPDWRPGAYAFISTPTLTFFPQSHPFTIASRPSKHRDDSIKDYDYSINTTTSPLQKSASKVNVTTPSPNLIFLIRARNGWTRKIRELALRETYPTIPILIDGPYGGCPPLHIGFDTVILFAGGAGLSWTLPLLTDLVERSRRGHSAVRRITWICVLRHYVNYDWFFSEVESIGQLGSSTLLDLRIHYTTNAQEADIIPHHFHPGRPNIQAIIENAVHESLGRVFVGVSGPLGPSEEVRRQCRKVTSPMAILKGDPRGDIHFHSELFGW